MGKIDLARVIIGGLVAGVVLTVGGYLGTEVLFAEMGAELFEKLGVPEPGGTQIALFIVLSFVIGIALTWLYAAIRPRFGASIKTAVIAGLTGWFFGSLLAAANFAVLEVMTPGQAAVGTLFDLVVIVIATVAGAWLYREGGSSSA